MHPGPSFTVGRERNSLDFQLSDTANIGAEDKKVSF